ncbi:MAG: WD40/YVTN/BNR-like repeat-containing protein [Phenylobacterium sp.]|uniref:WD40/YVTN/BNR-like repeat-containing protein n=1 Tax=Phenylobacterium sp. TaxID=1871053 RepID=UPI00391D08CC
MTDAVQLLVGTRKGAWIYRSDGSRQAWSVQGPIFLGHIVNHLVLDPRDGKTLLMAAATGHLGPTIFRSVDGGANWVEAERPPAFPKAPEGAPVRAVDHSFWLEPGHEDEPGVWWAGTSPPGLFRSADGGVTWDSVPGFNDHPMYWKWCPEDGGTPDGALLNQIQIDPRDPAHMYIATSTAGVFESLDQGASWAPLNQGVEANFLPDPYPEYGQDAHYVAIAPAMPDRLWQQNHCGIYRLDRPATRWDRIGTAMPPEIGDIGFTIVPHPREADTAWVFPMDGTEVWPRTSPGGRPATYRTRDAGRSWERQDRGFPAEQGWFTVKRQAFCADAAEPLGLYLGTTGGELWMSDDEGGAWRTIARHLPEIYSVVAAPLR